MTVCVGIAADEVELELVLEALLIVETASVEPATISWASDETTNDNSPTTRRMTTHVAGT